MTGDDVSAWDLRLGLAKKGWMSELRIDRNGIGNSEPDKVHVGFWARTSYHNGMLTDICLHAHIIIKLDDVDAIGKILSLVRHVSEACHRSVQEFPDTIPCMSHDSKDGRMGLVVAQYATDHASAPNEKYRPTENLPDSLDGWSIRGRQAHLEALRDAFLSGVFVEDSLNPFFGRGRYASDCQNREWGYKLRSTVKVFKGVKLRYNPQETMLRNLNELMVSDHISGSTQSLLRLFGAFDAAKISRGATPNGLPPGFQTLAEYITEREASRPDPDVSDCEPTDPIDP